MVFYVVCFGVDNGGYDGDVPEGGRSFSPFHWVEILDYGGVLLWWCSVEVFISGV